MPKDNDDYDVRLSKRLSYLLRHGAIKEGLKIKADGFVAVNELLPFCFRGCTLYDIAKVVEENYKKRFTLTQSNGVWEIKANQGHSLETINNLYLRNIKSVNFDIVHGTYYTNWESIKQQGLSRRTRNHIHFAKGLNFICGLRRNAQVFIYIDFEKAIKDNILFFESENSVILSPGNSDGIFLIGVNLTLAIMLELCTICDKYIEQLNMQSHVLGKKHLRLAEVLDRDKRSIIVNIPGNISVPELYSFFSQRGTIKNHRTTASKISVVFEFTDTRDAEFLTTNPIYMKHRKLRIISKVSYHEIQKQRDQTQEQDTDWVMKKLREKANVECNGVISYDKIQNVFSENSTFDSQLSAFLNVVQLTAEELNERYNLVCDKLNITFSSIFPKCKTYKFGSTNMGLGFKECDLDIFMDIGEHVCDTNESSQGWTTPKIFAKMKTVVYRLPQVFSNVIWIRSARVPIAKFRFVPTNVSCDVSFKNSLGVHKTDLIRYCLSLDERLTKLMVLIKYWGRHFKITLNGYLRNYALILLVIFFFQQPSVNILPSILDLQKPCTPKYVDGWQVNFSTTVAKKSDTNTSTIPELLHGFFSFYSTFDFQSQIICTLDGVAHPRTVFAKQHDLPACVSRYNEYMAVNTDAPALIVNNRGMSIQDPIELNHNITVRTTGDMLQNFIGFCEVGEEVCASAAKQNSTNLLSNLFITLPGNVLVNGQIALKFIVGQYNSDPSASCSLAVQCVKSALEETFQLQVETLIRGKNIKERILRCTGTWSGAELDASDIIQSSEQNVKLIKEGNSDGKCPANKSDLEFICSFKMYSMPAEFDVLFTNQKLSHEVFTNFISFVNIKLSPIVYRTLSRSVEGQQ